MRDPTSKMLEASRSSKTVVYAGSKLKLGFVAQMPLCREPGAAAVPVRCWRRQRLRPRTCRRNMGGTCTTRDRVPPVVAGITVCTSGPARQAEAPTGAAGSMGGAPNVKRTLPPVKGGRSVKLKAEPAEAAAKSLTDRTNRMSPVDDIAVKSERVDTAVARGPWGEVRTSLSCRSSLKADLLMGLLTEPASV